MNRLTMSCWTGTLIADGEYFYDVPCLACSDGMGPCPGRG